MATAPADRPAARRRSPPRPQARRWPSVEVAAEGDRPRAAAVAAGTRAPRSPRRAARIPSRASCASSVSVLPCLVARRPARARYSPTTGGRGGRDARLSLHGNRHPLQRCRAGGGRRRWTGSDGALLPRPALLAPDVGRAGRGAPRAISLPRLRPSRAGRERGAGDRPGHGHARRGRRGAGRGARHRPGALRRSVDGRLRRDAAGGAAPGAGPLARAARHLRRTRNRRRTCRATAGWSGSRAGSACGRWWARCRPSCTGRARGAIPARAADLRAWREHLLAPRSGRDAAGGGGRAPARERRSPCSTGSGAPRWCWWARRTPRRSPSAPGSIAAVIAGARLVRVPRAGHMSPIDAPEAVTAELRAFLASVG